MNAKLPHRKSVDLSNDILFSYVDKDNGPSIHLHTGIILSTLGINLRDFAFTFTQKRHTNENYYPHLYSIDLFLSSQCRTLFQLLRSLPS